MAKHLVMKQGSIVWLLTGPFTVNRFNISTKQERIRSRSRSIFSDQEPHPEQESKLYNQERSRSLKIQTPHTYAVYHTNTKLDTSFYLWSGWAPTTGGLLGTVMEILAVSVFPKDNDDTLPRSGTDQTSTHLQLPTYTNFVVIVFFNYCTSR